MVKKPLDAPALAFLDVWIVAISGTFPICGRWHWYVVAVYALVCQCSQKKSPVCFGLSWKYKLRIWQVPFSSGYTCDANVAGTACRYPRLSMPTAQLCINRALDWMLSPAAQHGCYLQETFDETQHDDSALLPSTSARIRHLGHLCVDVKYAQTLLRCQIQFSTPTRFAKFCHRKAAAGPPPSLRIKTHWPFC